MRSLSTGNRPMTRGRPDRRLWAPPLLDLPRLAPRRRSTPPRRRRRSRRSSTRDARLPVPLSSPARPPPRVGTVDPSDLRTLRSRSARSNISPASTAVTSRSSRNTASSLPRRERPGAASPALADPRRLPRSERAVLRLRSDLRGDRFRRLPRLRSTRGVLRRRARRVVRRWDDLRASAAG
jgi:hypothetical protein